MAIKLLYLGNRLSDKGRNISTIDTLADGFRNLGYQVSTYSNQRNQLLRLISMLWAVIQYRHVDFLLIDTYSTLGFWYAYLSGILAQKLNIKYIPILHGGNLPKRLKSHPKACQQLFSKAYINIAPSAYLLLHFQQAGYKNLSYIPNTIELKNYTYQERCHIAPRLLWVRSFAHIYNPILALKVLHELLASYPYAQLSMVGPFKDDSIEACKAYAKKHKLPVIFTGGMTKTDWIKYAQDFDIFINTTNVDNTPVSVIEGMALGLPVVTTNVGGIPYLLEDEKEALLVPPDNVPAMKQAIISLLENPDKTKSLSKTGRQKVEAFDWDVVKKQWVRILNHAKA